MHADVNGFPQCDTYPIINGIFHSSFHCMQDTFASEVTTIMLQEVEFKFQIVHKN